MRVRDQSCVPGTAQRQAYSAPLLSTVACWHCRCRSADGKAGSSSQPVAQQGSVAAGASTQTGPGLSEQAQELVARWLSQVQTDTHTHIHTRAHAHACAHTHTHTHTHTYIHAYADDKHWHSVYLAFGIPHPSSPPIHTSRKVQHTDIGALCSAGQKRRNTHGGGRMGGSGR